MSSHIARVIAATAALASLLTSTSGFSQPCDQPSCGWGDPPPYGEDPWKGAPPGQWGTDPGNSGSPGPDPGSGTVYDARYWVNDFVKGFYGFPADPNIAPSFDRVKLTRTQRSTLRAAATSFHRLTATFTAWIFASPISPPDATAARHFARNTSKLTRGGAQSFAQAQAS